MARAMMLVASNVTDPERVDEFHAWYANHVDELLSLEGIVSATRWAVSPHAMLPGISDLDGRSFLALYEIECDDLERMRDRIVASSPERTHGDTLEMSPPPITLLFEFLGAFGRDGDAGGGGRGD